jgi:hypothetical protein
MLTLLLFFILLLLAVWVLLFTKNNSSRITEKHRADCSHLALIVKCRFTLIDAQLLEARELRLDSLNWILSTTSIYLASVCYFCLDGSTYPAHHSFNRKHNEKANNFYVGFIDPSGGISRRIFIEDIYSCFTFFLWSGISSLLYFSWLRGKNASYTCSRCLSLTIFGSLSHALQRWFHLHMRHNQLGIYWTIGKAMSPAVCWAFRRSKGFTPQNQMPIFLLHLATRCLHRNSPTTATMFRRFIFKNGSLWFDQKFCHLSPVELSFALIGIISNA